MTKILMFSALILILISCRTQQTEYLEFESSNAMFIVGNKTSIKLIPKKSNANKKVIVKIYRKNEYFDNKKISAEKYSQILNLYAQISEKDSSKTVWVDPPTLEIKYRKENYQKDFYYIGIPKNNEKFRELLDLILESAKLDINEI